MDLIDFSLYQNLLSSGIFVFGLILVGVCSRVLKTGFFWGLSLFVYHTACCVLFWYFSLSNISDANYYYDQSLVGEADFYPGIPFVVFVTELFSIGLQASYLNTFLCFNLFGLLGLLLFAGVLKRISLDSINRPFIGLLSFLPSLSFWSAAIGKDSIAFLAVNMFILYFVNNKSIFFMFLSVLLMFMVRPHIALIMLGSAFVYFMVKSSLGVIYKMVAVLVIAIPLLLGIEFVYDYVGIGGLGDLKDYIEQREAMNADGGSSLDISSLNYPQQVFTYLYRPMFYEAQSAIQMMAAIENLILLLITVVLLFGIRIKRCFRAVNFGLFVYFLVTLSILAMTTANLGLAVRQKLMILPVLLVLLLISNRKMLK